MKAIEQRTLCTTFLLAREKTYKKIHEQKSLVTNLLQKTEEIIWMPLK